MYSSFFNQFWIPLIVHALRIYRVGRPCYNEKSNASEIMPNTAFVKIQQKLDHLVSESGPPDLHKYVTFDI